MDWHNWIRTHEEARTQIAIDFISTVDFEAGHGFMSKSFYRSSDITTLPDDKMLVVEYRIEDRD